MFRSLVNVFQLGMLGVIASAGSRIFARFLAGFRQDAVTRLAAGRVAV